MRGPACLLILLVAGPALRAQPADADVTAERVVALADAYMAAWFERYPENATFLGLPFARHDRSYDNSIPAERAWEAQVDSFYHAFLRLDAEAVAGRTEWVTHGFLRYALESSIQSRVCRSELWNVDQLTGAHLLFPVLATRQPVGTEESRRAALARFGSYGTFFDNEITSLREGVRLGYTAPRGNVEIVIAQLGGMLARTGQDSPYNEPAGRDSAAEFRADWLRMLETTLLPSLARYREFLREEYLPVARTETAVSAVPDGAECYRALLRSATSRDVEPRELHQAGLRSMEQFHAEAGAIGAQSFGTADAAALFERMRSDPGYRHASGDEILTVADSALARARRAAPSFFGRLPRAGVVIEPIPDYEAPSAPVGAYFPPGGEAHASGIFRINLHEPESRHRALTEDVTFHETIPGHHMQMALAMERPSAHPITRFRAATAYTEGWGLYSERLADEMGLYSTDLDRLGMLSALALRAARLVVDTGLHALGWNREQAIAYMLANTAQSRDQVEVEVDRFIIMPGQGGAYLTGYNEMMALRAEAQAALGDRFDLSAFHDMVLADGAVTLPMLRTKVERWIAGQP